MAEFTVRTAEQLPALLQGFRKQAGLTQAATAMRLGVTQQTLSALERNAEKISADRLLQAMAMGETLNRVHATLEGGVAVTCEFA